MPINFFNADCQSVPTNETEFGICDDEDGSKAYIDFSDKLKWIATVNNPNQRVITLTAVDACVEIRRENNEMENRCDAMLTYSENIVFVELKNQRGDWIQKAIEQLEISIGHFLEAHGLESFKHKRAFACNKKHPHFRVIDTETKQRFYSKYKVRLNVSAKIGVK